MTSWNLGRRLFAFGLVAAALTAAVGAAELQPRTVQAFQAYVAAVETRAAAPFLWLDTLPAPDQARHSTELKAGGLVIERLRLRPKAWARAQLDQEHPACRSGRRRHQRREPRAGG
jgi:hypothetical protein